MLESEQTRLDWNVWYCAECKYIVIDQLYFKKDGLSHTIKNQSWSQHPYTWLDTYPIEMPMEEVRKYVKIRLANGGVEI